MCDWLQSSFIWVFFMKFYLIIPVLIFWSILRMFFEPNVLLNFNLENFFPEKICFRCNQPDQTLKNIFLVENKFVLIYYCWTKKQSVLLYKRINQPFAAFSFIFAVLSVNQRKIAAWWLSHSFQFGVSVTELELSLISFFSIKFLKQPYVLRLTWNLYRNSSLVRFLLRN